jgi:hypothetical protein
MRGVLDRLYRTKMALSCLVLVVSGISAIALGRAVEATGSWSVLKWVPWQELGGILIGAGALSVWLDHFLRREQEHLDELRLRHLFREQAPVMRDAVLDAFAANHEDLARVATPGLLDQLITNSLALRLDDRRFAEEIYQDIRDQAVGSSERWHDAALSVELSPADPGVRSKRGAELFAVTVRWEYRTVPQHPTRRFVCVGDRREYAEMAGERGATSAWYLKPGTGIDPSTARAFELVQFAVNGQERPIRRAVRKSGQVYTASVGAAHVAAKTEVTIAYTYRTLTSQAGHLLFFDIEQPTRDLKVELAYANCGIASVATLDMIPSVRSTRIEHSPASLPGRTVRVDVDGWVFPRSGIAFVWTLESESRPARRVA